MITYLGVLLPTDSTKPFAGPMALKVPKVHVRGHAEAGPACCHDVVLVFPVSALLVYSGDLVDAPMPMQRRTMRGA